MVAFAPNTSLTIPHNKIIFMILQFIVAFLWIYLYRLLDLNRFFNNQKSPTTTIFLGYIYIALYTLIIITESFRSYVGLVFSIILFTLIQMIFVEIIFFHARKHRNKIYQNNLAEKQIINLKVYTDQLEKDQLKLRHFKHDYKNLLFGLKTVTDEQDYDAMIPP